MPVEKDDRHLHIKMVAPARLDIPVTKGLTEAWTIATLPGARKPVHAYYLQEYLYTLQSIDVEYPRDEPNYRNGKPHSPTGRDIVR